MLVDILHLNALSKIILLEDFIYRQVIEFNIVCFSSVVIILKILIIVDDVTVQGTDQKIRLVSICPTPQKTFSDCGIMYYTDARFPFSGTGRPQIKTVPIASAELSWWQLPISGDWPGSICTIHDLVYAVGSFWLIGLKHLIQCTEVRHVFSAFCFCYQFILIAF